MREENQELRTKLRAALEEIEKWKLYFATMVKLAATDPEEAQKVAKLTMAKSQGPKVVPPATPDKAD